MAELEDLQRVFCILDGKPEEDHRNGLYRRLAAAERVPDQPYGEAGPLRTRRTHT